MEKPKAKRSAFDYLPWAGIFVDPEQDAELFAQLPGTLQRERLFHRAELAKGRRPSLDEITRAGEGDAPERLIISLPAALTLDSLQRRQGGEYPVGSMMRELESHLVQEKVFEHCTAFGEGRKLLVKAPVHGLYAYLWARALVFRGHLKTLPLPYFWELEEGLADVTSKLLNTRAASAQPLLDMLDRKARSLAASVA